MNTAKKLMEILTAFNYPVKRLRLKSDAKRPETYFLIQLIKKSTVMAASDLPLARESVWAIDLYSKKDYSDLLDSVIDALEDNDFYDVSIETELYDHDTAYFHVSLLTRKFEDI
jgi:hypothetical protein